MLDDLKYIHQRDVQDALGIAEKQWKQYTHKYELDLPEDWDPLGFAVAGMGGSALAASAIASIPGTDVPFEVVRDYNLPEFVNENWVLICSSYSGNTEETLSIFKQAIALSQAKRPMLICLSSGGELAKLAAKNEVPHVKLPGGFQPRFTFGYQYAALAQIMETVGAAKGLSTLLEQGSELVEKAITQWEPTVPKKDNWAKQLAMEIAGKSAVIYSSSKLFPAAYKWKISINETAKNVAWCSQYPEFNHNEFMGWASHPNTKPYTVIDLRSQYDHPQIQKRFEISERLLSGKRPMPEIVNIPKGEHILHDMMWAIALGDFVSIYLALANGVNPTPVDLIEKLKSELA